MNKLYGIIGLLTALFLGLGTAEATLSQAEAIRTLKGIRSIPIVVEEVDAEAQAAGLTTSDLQTECELRLRKVGISVPVSGEPVDRDSPYLYVYVNVFPANSGDQYVFNANLEFRQKVGLVRNKSILALATTWNTGTTGVIMRPNLSKVRNSVGNLMDEFANAYLSANPKK